jgi:5-deoxy-glucuronate isomerase
MASLKAEAQGTHGRVHHVTPETAGWSYVGFDLWKLAPGESAGGGLPDKEVCLVLVAGKARVRVDGTDLGELGGRMSPFEGPGYSVYAPAGAKWEVTATTGLELAVCTAPGTPASHPARVITPDDVTLTTRGKGTNVRYPYNILPEDKPADSLLIVEVITPGGHTSSYPPHKHDRDALPEESYLEETYYHRFSKPQGFGFQRVYTDDRSLDETMLIEDGDVVMVPRGYHPVAAVHGYDIYYLNVMAGPKRTWKFYNAPEHEWMLHG